MNTLIDFSSTGLLFTYIIGGLVVIFIGYYAAKTDERTARRNGAHVKSKHRELALASELPSCVPPQNTMQKDPYNDFFPSYTTGCAAPGVELVHQTERSVTTNRNIVA